MVDLLRKIAAATLLTLFVTATASAEEIIVNGSFEDGEINCEFVNSQKVCERVYGVGGYYGWTLEEPYPPEAGTWGIILSGEELIPYTSTYDFCHEQPVTQYSNCLDFVNIVTLSADDGNYVAYQIANPWFQSGVTYHLMYQDVKLTENSKLLHFSLSYMSHSPFSEFQRVTVWLKDLEGVSLITDSQGEPSPLYNSQNDAVLSMDLTPMKYDISSFANQTVRLEVEVVQVDDMLASFDNFWVEEVADATTPPADDTDTGDDVAVSMPTKIPPGWAKKPKPSWDGKIADIPEELVGKLPPGVLKQLEKMGKLPPGLMKENKGQQKKNK